MLFHHFLDLAETLGGILSGRTLILNTPSKISQLCGFQEIPCCSAAEVNFGSRGIFIPFVEAVVCWLRLYNEPVVISDMAGAGYANGRRSL